MICMLKALYYCQQMYLRTFKISALKYMSLVMQNVFQLLSYHVKQIFKKSKLKLDILSDFDMLLMGEKGIRGRIYHYIFQNNYMKDYHKNKES